MSRVVLKSSDLKVPSSNQPPPPSLPLPSNPAESTLTLSAQDIKNLDVNALRENMVRAIYVLEASLFSQAGFEHDRINKLRHLITKVEGELFSEDSLNNLNADQKIKIYQMMMQNMNNSMNFISRLHQNIASGIEAVNSIDKLKRDTIKDDVSTPAPADSGGSLEQIKNMILDQIKEKSK